MNKNTKKIIEYISPPIFNDLVRLIRAFIFTPNYYSLIKSNKEYYGIHSGEKVFVIANGPSIDKINTDIYFGEKVIVMNSFQKAKWKNSVDIVAHCMGEPYIASAWSEEDILESIEGTDSQSYWLHYSSFGKINGVSKEKKLNYVFLPFEAGVWKRNNIQLHKPTLAYQTTAQLAIQVALHMGFKEIVLLGFDHDWLASPKYLKHFYSVNKDDTDKIGEMTYMEIIKLTERMWDIYYKIHKISLDNGVKIYNMNSYSYLDVFEIIE